MFSQKSDPKNNLKARHSKAMDAMSVNSGPRSRQSVRKSGGAGLKPPLIARDSKIQDHLKTLDSYTQNADI